MENVVGFALVSIIILSGIIISYTGLMPVLNDVKTSSKIESAKSQLLIIDNAISAVSLEGKLSSRVVQIYNPVNLMVNPEGKIFYYKIISNGNLKKFYGKHDNILITSGGDVNCFDDGTYYIMENSHLRAKFYKYGSESSYVPLNTSKIINEMIQKETGASVDVLTPINVRDESSVGNGYSELLEYGSNLPECSLKVHFNSTYPYDVYFTLKSGDDFIITKIKISNN